MTMKKIEVVKVYSRNSEVHFVLRECSDTDCLNDCADFSYSRVKKMMKKEAAKPLLLLRAE